MKHLETTEELQALKEAAEAETGLSIIDKTIIQMNNLGNTKPHQRFTLESGLEMLRENEPKTYIYKVIIKCGSEVIHHHKIEAEYENISSFIKLAVEALQSMLILIALKQHGKSFLNPPESSAPAELEPEFKPLKGVHDDTAIQCISYEIGLAVLKIANEHGYRHLESNQPLTSNDLWKFYTSKGIYFTFEKGYYKIWKYDEIDAYVWKCEYANNMFIYLNDHSNNVKNRSADERAFWDQAYLFTLGNETQKNGRLLHLINMLDHNVFLKQIDEIVQFRNKYNKA